MYHGREDILLVHNRRIAVHTSRWLPVGVTAVHAALTAVMVWWVITLWIPPSPFPTGMSFEFFTAHWPFTPHGWAVVFLLPSAVGVAGLAVSFRWRWTRLFLSAGLALAHVLLALATYSSSPAGTAWGLYTIFAALGLWRMRAEASIEWVTR
jgi:hypothetical protein